MPWDQEEVEGHALDLRRAAGCDDVVPITGITLAQCYVGRRNVLWLEELDQLGRPAQCSRRESGWVIELARRLVDQPVAANWWSAHEVCEISLIDRPMPYVEPDIERLCNRVAAAAIVPGAALRAAVHAWGLDLRRLADQFVVSEYTIVLRLAEALNYPIAIVCEQPLLEQSIPVIRKGPPIPLRDVDLIRWSSKERRPSRGADGVFRRRLTDRTSFHAFIGPRGGWDE